MSKKSQAGKAAWTALATTYSQDLATQLAEDSKAEMDAWKLRGRVPLRVRLMTRLTGRGISLSGR